MEPKAAMDRILARHRQRLGKPVSIEEIFQLHEAAEGTASLTDEDRERLLERVAADPEAAGKLRTLMRFPEMDALAEEAGVEVRWSEFQQRLAASAPRTPADPTHPRLPETSSSIFLPHPWLKAASLILCAGSLFMIGRFTAPKNPAAPITEELRLNVKILELSPLGAASNRGGSEKVALTAESEGLMLMMDGTGVDSTEPLTLRVTDAEGRDVAQDSGLIREESGQFVAVLPAGNLAAGAYRAELLDTADRLEATFTFEVQVDR